MATTTSTIASTATQDVDIKPMQILSLGMLRTGSASITQALEILGYKNVHHGIKSISNPNDWVVFSAAADAFYPSLPSYRGQPFTRADWDRVFGRCEAVTDMASFFAVPLMDAYPDAQVILVERDVDDWFDSMDEAILQAIWGWRSRVVVILGRVLLGLNGHATIKTLILGFYGAKNVSEVRRKARQRYRQHYDEIRAAAAKGRPGRLLEYDLAQGWGPLCEFLGKPVPDVPFPRANVREEHLKRMRGRQTTFLWFVLKRVVKTAAPWVVGGVVAWAGVRMGWWERLRDILQ